MLSHQPIVNGIAVNSCVETPWAPDDDSELPLGWSVVGRASVHFPQGGLANGLLLSRIEGSRTVRACVIWERPQHGGAGRFRLVPLGAWV